jgi:hypothetical protein
MWAVLGVVAEYSTSIDSSSSIWELDTSPYSSFESCLMTNSKIFSGSYCLVMRFNTSSHT